MVDVVCAQVFQGKAFFVKGGHSKGVLGLTVKARALTIVIMMNSTHCPLGFVIGPHDRNNKFGEVAI